MPTVDKSEYLNPDKNVRTLAAKVQWDVHFYFTRRGRENFHIMTKDWFAIKHDDKTDCRFVVKIKDEETKNHKTTEEALTTAFMPEIKGDPYCPVGSFVHYMDALSPKSNSLWQTTKFTNFQSTTKKFGIMEQWVTTNWIHLLQTLLLQ